MAKETMIVFVYDTEYCKNETYDPINAVLYFHPSWVSDVQKVALCGQLMGTTQFLKHCFSRPKIIALENGKFVLREFRRFLTAIGTDRNISDNLLEHRANILASMFEFFHRDLQAIYDQFPLNKHNKNVSEKLYHIFGTYLPILQHNGNIFQNVPKLRIPKIASNIFLDAVHTLQNCQQTKGVLGGAILYHNKVIATQLSDDITKNVVYTDPLRIKSTAEVVTANFHIPVGVQIIVVYIPIDHYNMLSADAYRSQTLRTQHLFNDTLPGSFQKRKIKRDRSIAFSNIPEEHSCECDQTQMKKVTQRPTYLPLKEHISNDLNESGDTSGERKNLPEFVFRTSICSTPMTENKILHGKGIMSICGNPNEDVNISKPIRNSFKMDFDKIISKFANNSQFMERRNSFTDLQDSVKRISKKFSINKTFSSYKVDVSSPEGDKTYKISRATSDPMHSYNKTSSSIIDLFQYEKDFNEKIKENKVEHNDNFPKNKTQLSKEFKSNGKTLEKSCTNKNQDHILINQALKTQVDKKSLTLPLKAYSDIQNEHCVPAERIKMSGMQLTPLMAKLSVLPLGEERYSLRDSSQSLDYTTPSDKKRGSKKSYLEECSSRKGLHSNGFQKVELYICGQQNMTLFLLLEQGSTQNQDIVRTMFDKCVAKLGKMESYLYQTLSVNMMEGVSKGIYSLICVDSKRDTLLNHGPWTPLDQSFLEHMRTDFSKSQPVTDIFLRTGDCIFYGYKSDRTEFFFKESSQYFIGIPPPSDPMGSIAIRAKSLLEEDFSIVLF